MIVSTEILKTALLGTDKYMPATTEQYALMHSCETGEKESTFLRQANISLLMDEAGQTIRTSQVELPACRAEQKETLDPHKTEQLKTILTSNDEALFQFMIWYCNQYHKIVPSFLVPKILNKAILHVKHAAPLLSVCGETGRWLCSLNEKWKPLYTAPDDTADWELGNLTQRKNHLLALRKTDPELALQLLEKSLSAENAANRLELLTVINEQLSAQDETFLLTLLKDKSQKVKDVATQLLAQIHGSEINTKLVQALQQVLSVKEERHLLIAKKKVLHLNETITLPDDIFKLGIEKVSAVKGMKDPLYWALQLISLLHPEQVSSALHVNENDLMALLLKMPRFNEILPFIVSSVLKYRHQAWAIELIKSEQAVSVDLLNCIAAAEQPNYTAYFEKEQIAKLAEHLMDGNYSEYKSSFAKKLIDWLEQNPYQQTPQFYQLMGLHLPADMLPKLQAITGTEKEDYQFKYFKNQLMETIRVIEIKQTILNS
ncbi:MAG: hypothetical protein IT257_06615 [Chitinophagaceae bacterium]|nr:hypothetical protein [Chitinophagaceae bacterium]